MGESHVYTTLRKFCTGYGISKVGRHLYVFVVLLEIFLALAVIDTVIRYRSVPKPVWENVLRPNPLRTRRRRSLSFATAFRKCDTRSVARTVEHLTRRLGKANATSTSVYTSKRFIVYRVNIPIKPTCTQRLAFCYYIYCFVPPNYINTTCTCCLFHIARFLC